MGDVVSIENKKPHLSGTFKCLHCNHEHVGVAPVGVDTVECPECGLVKAVAAGLCAPPESSFIFECGCGCQYFNIMQDGFFCMMCGVTHSYSEL